MDKANIYNDITKYARLSNIDGIGKCITLLLSIRNEINKLLANFIDMFFQNEYWSPSISVNQVILDALDTIVSLPKRQLLKQQQFHDSLATFSSYICHRKHPELVKWTRIIDDIDDLRLQRKLEPLLMCREAYNECKIVTKLFRKHMTQETAKLFDILYSMLRHQNKKQTLLLLTYILNTKNTPLDKIPSTYDMFDDIREEYKADVVWYVWWFITEYFKKTQHNDHHTLALYTFRLFKYFYTPKTRKNRLNVIYLVVCLAFVSDISIYNDVKIPLWTPPTCATPQNQKTVKPAEIDNQQLEYLNTLIIYE